jgi:hypothetical protein
MGRVSDQFNNTQLAQHLFLPGKSNHFMGEDA